MFIIGGMIGAQSVAAIGGGIWLAFGSGLDISEFTHDELVEVFTAHPAVLIPGLYLGNCAAIGLSFIVAALRPMPLARYFAFVRPSRKQLLLPVAIYLAYTLAVFFFERLMELPTPEFMQSLWQAADSPLAIAGMMLMICVLAPIGEELIFRGFLFKGLYGDGRRPLLAIVVSTLAWMALHVQYEAFILVMLVPFGFVLGFARHYSRSIYVPLGMHMVNNAFAMVTLLLFTE